MTTNPIANSAASPLSGVNHFLTPDMPPIAANMELKSFVGDYVVKGGNVLKGLSDGLVKGFARSPEQQQKHEEAQSTKQKVRVKSAKTAIEASQALLEKQATELGISDVDIPSLALHNNMVKGQNLRTAAVFFNTACAFIGGAAGCFAGMYISHLGGAVGAVVGALGGAFIGTVAGHVAGKDIANYLLKGMGISEDDDKHKGVVLLVQCGFGAIGALIGFGSGLVGGGTLGAFLGEICIVGGLTKAGLGLGWLLGSATLGGYLDNHGKAYQEAVKDKLQGEGFEYKGPAIAPSLMDRAAKYLEEALKRDSSSSSKTRVENEVPPSSFADLYLKTATKVIVEENAIVKFCEDFTDHFKANKTPAEKSKFKASLKSQIENMKQGDSQVLEGIRISKNIKGKGISVQPLDDVIKSYSLITNMNKLLRVQDINPTPTNSTNPNPSDQEAPIKGGSALKTLNQTFSNIFETLIVRPGVAVNNYFEEKEKKTKEAREERQTRYDEKLGASSRITWEGGPEKSSTQEFAKKLLTTRTELNNENNIERLSDMIFVLNEQIKTEKPSIETEPSVIRSINVSLLDEKDSNIMYTLKKYSDGQFSLQPSDASASQKTTLISSYSFENREGNTLKYFGGAAICATSILGRIVVDLAGIGGGLVVGAAVLHLTAPILALKAIGSAIGGAIEGAVVGFVGGYLLAEWLSGKSGVKNLIDLEYKETYKNTKGGSSPPADYKNSDEYKRFQNEKMKIYNANLTDYEKAKDAVWTGVALTMGGVGALIGGVGCCVLKGSLETFVVTAAILGGAVKLSMIVADHIFGAPLHHMYCCGAALEKANAPLTQFTPVTEKEMMERKEKGEESPHSVLSYVTAVTEQVSKVA